MLNNPGTNCCWCGTFHYGMSQCCDECYSIKEAAYKQARENNITSYAEIVLLATDKLIEANRMSSNQIPEFLR